MPFFRAYQHLLPDAAAWRLTTQKTLRSLFEGLADVAGDARMFVDDGYDDLFPGTTRELEGWELQFGLMPSAGATEAQRRQALTAAWQAQGGQSPRYIQDVLQAAGFPVYVHEWWEPPNAAPRTARDPRDYTEQPRIGTYQCTGYDSFGAPLAGQPQCTGRDPSGSPLPGQPQCNRFLTNETGYLVNLNLTNVAPPPVPDDPDAFPYFIYVGGEVFGTSVTIPAERRDEFERLLLKICPAHLWIVTIVSYGTWAFGDGYSFGDAGLVFGEPGP